MTVLTEGQHAGEHLISEAEHFRSRETGTLTQDENLVDGTLLMLSAGKLVAWDGTLDSNGVGVGVVGTLYGNFNASATGPKGSADWPNVPYIARAAQVQLGDLTFPTESTIGGEQAGGILALEALGIIVRND